MRTIQLPQNRRLLRQRTLRGINEQERVDRMQEVRTNNHQDNQHHSKTTDTIAHCEDCKGVGCE